MGQGGISPVLSDPGIEGVNEKSTQGKKGIKVVLYAWLQSAADGMVGPPPPGFTTTTQSSSKQ